MSSSLILIIDEHNAIARGSGIILGYNQVVIRDDTEIQERIRKLPASPLAPMLLGEYGDEGLKMDVTDDKYGDPLTWTYAKRIGDLTSANPEWSEWNRAVIAFMDALPPNTPVILVWN
jgi:hypothetical protein